MGDVNFVVKRHENIVKSNIGLERHLLSHDYASGSGSKYCRSANWQQTTKQIFVCNQTDLFLNIFTAYKYHKLSNFTGIVNVENK